MTTGTGKSSSLQDVQHVFTSHMRDPANQPAPVGMEDRRMKIYRDLVYNSIQDFIAGSFPVTRKIIPDDEWHNLLRDYVRDHQARTPLFPKMPREFLEYLQETGHSLLETYPFLLELAHYEWIETALFIDNREIDLDGIDRYGDLLTGIPTVNPLAVSLTCQWPVHLISRENVPDTAPARPVFIVIYRNLEDEVAFMVLNEVSARLIQHCTGNAGMTGEQLLTRIADELQHPQPASVIQGGVRLMRDKTVLPGTR